MDKVGKAAEKLRERREADAVKKEQLQLPDMISHCTIWAAERQLKRLNQADVESLLEEDFPDIHHTTVRTVWQKTNLDLKSN